MKRIPTYLFLLAALSSAAIPMSSALADVSSRDFKQVDADRSGTLNETEFGKLDQDRSFGDIDTNGDKMISLLELNQAPQDIAPASGDAAEPEPTTRSNPITGDRSVGSPNNGTTGSSGTAGMSNSGSAGTTTVQ